MKLALNSISKVLLLVALFGAVISAPIEEEECGISAREPKIIGGVEANANSWPWQVMLIMGKSGGSFLCGGSIISSRFILTAAHCVIDSIQINVFPELHVFPKNFSHHKSHIAKKWTIHEKYSNTQFALGYDIAIIELIEPLKFSETIQPVCLPKNSNHDLIKGVTGYIFGWGKNNAVSGTFPENLQQAQMTVHDKVSNKDCTQDLTKLYCLRHYASQSINACSGDSGGPFVYKQNNRWYVYGVASFVKTVIFLGYCDPAKPSFYTAVPLYLDWIAVNTK